MSLSNFRQRIQTRATLILSRILRRYGDTVTYTHLAGSPITNLLASPGKEEKRALRSHSGYETDEEITRIFWIPLTKDATGTQIFPAPDISQGDKITYQSVDYIVESYINADDVGAYYKITTIKTTATKLGAV